MTQEQKAKAYDEALEKARKYRDEEGFTEMEDLFPELALSEDERMIIGLQGFLSAYGSDYFGTDGWQKFDDWLERQKEQKDYRKLYKGVSQSEWFKENYEGKSLGEEQKPVKIRMDNPNIQKVDPDVKVTTSDSSASGDELLYVSNKSYNIGYRDGKREAESKQEWSEEDEVYLQDALWCVEKAEESCKDEEDKGACWSAQRWLKSLRPSWKPSEEQMRAFKSYIEDSQSKAEAAVGGWDKFDVMIHLYEQLKKL